MRALCSAQQQNEECTLPAVRSSFVKLLCSVFSPPLAGSESRGAPIALNLPRQRRGAVAARGWLGEHSARRGAHSTQSSTSARASLVGFLRACGHAAGSAAHLRLLPRAAHPPQTAIWDAWFLADMTEQSAQDSFARGRQYLLHPVRRELFSVPTPSLATLRPCRVPDQACVAQMARRRFSFTRREPANADFREVPLRAAQPERAAGGGAAPAVRGHRSGHRADIPLNGAVPRHGAPAAGVRLGFDQVPQLSPAAPPPAREGPARLVGSRSPTRKRRFVFCTHTKADDDDACTGY